MIIIEVEVDLEAGSSVAAGVQSNGSITLPKLVSVTISKSNRDALVGLGVTDKLGSYGTVVPVINSIKEGSLCSGTALQIGMHLYKINGVPCKGKDDATAMLKVSEGSITIVAGPPGLVWATVSKASKETKVGLHMERYKNSDKVFIGNVKGLFAKTDLKPNMTILQINDKDVTGVPMPEVLEMVSEAEGKITVLAQAPLDLGQKLLSHPPPEGLAGGEWGSTTYVGSLTGALAIAGIITGIGWIIILLFCPSDKIDVYKLDGKLFTPNGGEFFFRKQKFLEETVLCIGTQFFLLLLCLYPQQNRILQECHSQKF